MIFQDQRFRGQARALLVIDQRVLADVVTLALSHGHYITRVADTAEQAVGDPGRAARPTAELCIACALTVDS